MKTRVEKLLFILILVVSIMAIVITASQIYEIIQNEKIIANSIKGIESDENTYIKNENSIYYSDSEKGTNYKSIVSVGGWSTRTVSQGQQIRDRTELTAQYNIISLDIESQETLIYDTLNVKLDFDTISGNGNYDSVTTDIVRQVNNLDTDIDYDLENIPNPPFAGGSDSRREALQKYNLQQIGIKSGYTITINSPYSFHIDIVYIYGISSRRESQLKDMSTGEWRESQFYDIEDCNPIVDKLIIDISANSSSIESSPIKYGANPKFSVESNELLQIDTKINSKKLSQYIYEQITGEWGGGKETATLKCSIGEYYDESGTLAISTKNNDLPMTFNIRDLVIPYIPTARGGTEPMSIKLDGTPKVFQVTQVRPYFDGACWQEIMLQEYTGDNPSANKA